VSGRIRVGTSSWADPGFVAEWYPPRLPARERLSFYAERFEAVEVNSTFYAVPGEGTVRRWVTQTPPGFTFDVKLHRLLSRHAADLRSLPPDLRDGAETDERGRVRLTSELEASMIDAILEATAPLEDERRLATFLLQLTPAFAPRSHQLDELAPLVERFAPRPVAVELRHRGWVEHGRLEDTLGWLEDHEAVFVCVDAPEANAPTVMPPIDAVTRDNVAYLRARPLSGRALRLPLLRRRAAGDRRPRARPGHPRARRPSHVQQQPRRRRPNLGPANARAAGAGPGAATRAGAAAPPRVNRGVRTRRRRG